MLLLVLFPWQYAREFGGGASEGAFLRVTAFLRGYGEPLANSASALCQFSATPKSSGRENRRTEVSC